MYLFEITMYAVSGGDPTDLVVLSDLYTKYGVCYVSAKQVEGIRSSLTFGVKDSEFQGHFTISEFPGNCSALVLTGMDDLYLRCTNHCRMDIFYNIMKFADEFARRLQYYSVILTTINTGVVQSSEEVGYVRDSCLFGFVNQHSGKVNYFMVRVVDVITPEMVEADKIPGMRVNVTIRGTRVAKVIPIESEEAHLE